VIQSWSASGFFKTSFPIVARVVLSHVNNDLVYACPSSNVAGVDESGNDGLCQCLCHGRPATGTCRCGQINGLLIDDPFFLFSKSFHPHHDNECTASEMPLIAFVDPDMVCGESILNAQTISSLVTTFSMDLH
jgi:hypothetical protein